MAIDPLLSQATSRVVELQRGSGDEKRRQDSAASFLSRPYGPGGQGFAANDAPSQQDDLSSIGSRAGRSARPDVGQTPLRNEVGGDPGQPEFLRQANDLARNDRQSLFAQVGFSAQQLSQASEEAVVQNDGTGQGKSLLAASAYNSTQTRGDGAPVQSGQQVVMESGVVMGFGALDDFSRLDVSV